MHSTFNKIIILILYFYLNISPNDIISHISNQFRDHFAFGITNTWFFLFALLLQAIYIHRTTQYAMQKHNFSYKTDANAWQFVCRIFSSVTAASHDHNYRLLHLTISSQLMCWRLFVLWSKIAVVVCNLRYIAFQNRLNPIDNWKKKKNNTKNKNTKNGR